MNEVRVFGPPGTGKTTYLARQVTRAAQAKGSNRILVASFTRAAATEIAGRNLPVDRAQLGTLHALCYRSLGRPELTERKLDEWNKEVPHLALSGGGGVDLDHASFDQTGQTQGDQLMAQAEQLRAKMRPVDTWPTSVRAFFTRWTEWKRKHDLYDFTELIERSLSSAPPGSPSVGFFDEVQDFTPLDLELVRNWAGHMDTVLLAGDDDQCLYRFRGATPDAFLDPPVPDTQKRILSQSYRVPAAVHRIAQRWVEQLGRREPKEYAPRKLEDDSEAPGNVQLMSDVTWRQPARMMDSVEEQVAAGESVMILATCSYMLQPTLDELRKRGLPFHNPYRRKRGDWNPLAPRENAVTASDRLLAYLRPDVEVWGDEARLWTALDALWWLDPVKVEGTLKRGSKKLLKERAKNPDDVTELELNWLAEQVFTDQEGLSAAFFGDLDWWQSKLLKTASKSLSFPIQVARQRGARALTEPPRVVVGTIHSVKGGEAANVWLFPDVSNAGMREWLTRGEARDSVVRQFYVGVTRARERLTLLAPTTRAAVPLHKFMDEE